MKRFALLMCLALPALAAGKQANMSWTPATTYLLGHAFPAADVANYTVTWTANPGTAAASGTKVIAGTLTSASVDIPCGSVTFTVTVTTSSSAYVPNTTSIPSAGVSYDSGTRCAGADAPNPPTLKVY